MSARKFKPGDVVVIDGERALVQEMSSGDLYVEYADYARLGGRSVDSLVGRDVRPLVVIDPDDMLAVERLQDLYLAAEAKGLSGLSMKAALDEFADPKPRIEEPTGLGAVVEGADGEKWIRWEIVGRHPLPWTVPGAVKPNRSYDQIDVVRVLSPGWSE